MLNVMTNDDVKSTASLEVDNEGGYTLRVRREEGGGGEGGMREGEGDQKE